MVDVDCFSVLLFCCFLWVIVNSDIISTYEHNIACENEKSCNLSKILQELGNKTRVSLSTGKYYLNKNIELSNIHNILISGASKSLVSIECSVGDVGVAFFRSSGIKIRGLTVSKCGAPHISTSLYNVTFLAVFYFVYCRNVDFYDVSVSNNFALGVNMYDVGGTVKFDASDFTSNKMAQSGDVLSPSFFPARWSGGGIYVQFTYCGSMFGNGCTESDDIEHQKYVHHNNFVFKNCVFSRNYAPGPPPLPDTKNTDFLPPQKRDHMSPGRGGGLSLYLRGNASHNFFLVDNCSFVENFAIWGGGFFTEIVDSCFQNEVVITKTTFTGNKAQWAGGGIRYGLIQVFSNVEPYNNGTFKDILFEENSAMWGGATSVYSTEEALTSNNKASSQIHFSGVTWINNTASNGAAVGGASWKILSAGGVVVPIFKNTLFKNNHIFDYRASIQNSSSDFSYSVIKGQGTICTNAMPFHFRGKNQFLDNVGTVFLMTDAVLTVGGTMQFIRNHGHAGGGISLLGQSWISINPGSNFLFSKNTALRGAGIYVQNLGTPNRVASKNCFITYNAPTTAETLVSPDKWKTFFNFSYNNATVSGHSIYSSTLKYCGWFMEVYGFHERQMFNWSNFVYENISPLVGNEIATDPVQISLNKEDWDEMSPSDVTNPVVRLIDERNQVIPGVVNIKIQNTNTSNTQVDVSSGPFFPAENNIYSFKLSGKDNAPFSVSIQTVTGQIVKAIIPQVTLKKCRPGYHLQGYSRCVCLRSPEDMTEDSGITRCQGDRQVFIRKGLWAGTIGPLSNAFMTSPCPSRYCNFRCPPNTFCAPHEYLYLEDAHRQCEGHRTGILCGKCLTGYSVVLGSDKCMVCPKDYAWVGYFSAFLILGTLVVFGVLLVNVDISSGQYTGCLFFYQVVSLLVRDGFVPDPVLSFLMGLANAQVGVGACMWYGMTDLQKLGLTYVLPAYILFLCIIVIFLSRIRKCIFSRRSALRAFTTLFLISYTTFTSVSLQLLHFSTLGNKTVLFKSGEVEYFRGEHVGYGILAIVVCSIIVIPFPLCLCLVQPLSYLKPGLGGGKLKPFLDIFQYCYQNQYRWFSGIYYLARIVLLLIYTFIPDSALKHGLLCLTCIMLLTLQTNIRPYGNKNRNEALSRGMWLNLLDSLILMDLSLIGLLGSFSASSDSALTLINSKGYSVADYLCNVLMWLPAPYFIVVIVLNLYIGAKKNRKNAERKETKNRYLNEMTEASDAICNS